MADDEGAPSNLTVSRSGGVNIAADSVAVQGDVVGRDKITIYQGAPLPEIPPPPEPAQPPEAPGFVGREVELAYFADQLASRHLSVVTGMPGVGKTALAAVLARQTPDLGQVFWHEFHENESVTVLIWKLAGFLACHGQAELWRMLHSIQLTGGHSPPPEVLFDYLFQMLRGQAYLLCFDEFQNVDDDPLLEHFAGRLHEALSADDLSLIIVSQRTPAFIRTGEFEPLAGLSLDDTRAFLAGRGLVADLAQVKQAATFDTSAALDRRSLLPAEIVANLYARTEGNALFLTLVADRLVHTSNVIQFLARLFTDEDIERFLLNEIDRHLSEDGRAVMNAVAVLRGYPGTRQAIAAVLDGREVRRALSDLVERNLLRASEETAGRVYSMNALVRKFYYDGLNRPQRQALHRRAGDYYEKEQPDIFRAALHFESAGEFQKAAQLAADVRDLINQGQARPLQRLLERLKAEGLEPLTWISLNLARGQVHAVLGESEFAHASYRAAFTQLEQLPDSLQVRELKGRACLGLGDFLLDESPTEALEWLRRGLNELVGLSEAAASASDQRLKAALYIKIGEAQIHRGEYDAASGAMAQGLALLPEGPSQLHISALIDLGDIAARDNIGQAMAYEQQALEWSRQLNDYVHMTTIQSNLGIDKVAVGDWAGAVDDWKQALALAERLGIAERQASIENQLGVLSTRQGNYDVALTCLTQALELARHHNQKELVLCTLSSLADLRVRQGEWDDAANHLKEAESLSSATDIKHQLPEIYCNWARLYLNRQQRTAALEYATRALQVARDLGLAIETGIALRVQGQALWGLGQRPESQGAFAESLTLLSDEPYEAACTKLEWGRLLKEVDAAQAATLLREAHATFEQLGAQRDRQACEHILNG